MNCDASIKNEDSDAAKPGPMIGIEATVLVRTTQLTFGFSNCALCYTSDPSMSQPNLHLAHFASTLRFTLGIAFPIGVGRYLTFAYSRPLT